MPTKTKKPTVTVVFSTFDDRYAAPIYREIRRTALNKWVNITSRDYIPAGGTPLRDATARFIDHLSSIRKKGTVVVGILADESGSMNQNRLAVIQGINEFMAGISDIEVDPDTDGKVLAVIFTDGYENASKEVTASALQDMIREKEGEDWTFIYLGANQDAWETGRETGFSGASSGATYDFAATPEGTRSALIATTTSVGNYLSNYSAYAQNTMSGSIAEDGMVTNHIDEAVKKAKQ